MAIINLDKNVIVKFSSLENDLTSLQKYIRNILLDNDEKPMTKCTVIEQILKFQKKRGPILGNFTLKYKDRTYFENEPLEKKEFLFSNLCKYITDLNRIFENYKQIYLNCYIYYYFHMPHLNLYSNEDCQNLITRISTCKNTDDVLTL